MKSGARPDPEAAGGAYLNVGKTLSPYGLKGEIAVRPLTDDADRWLELREVSYLDGDQRRELTVASAWMHADRVIVRFAGYDTREAVAALKGRLLQVSRDQSPALPAGTYWMADLVGLAAETTAGEPIGTVRDVYQAGNDLLEIVTPDGRELLVPMVRAFVREVDLAGKRLVLDPIPGLLD